MALIKLGAEALQLSHDLQEVTLRSCILLLHPIFLLDPLSKSFLENDAFVQSLGKFDFIFLDNSASDLSISSVSFRAHVLRE